MLKNKNPPEKGEDTGIAMDNMKPSGSCPEKIEVVVVVVGSVVHNGPVIIINKKEFSCLIMREDIAKGAKKQNQVQFQILSALRSARFCGQEQFFLNLTPNCASSGCMYGMYGITCNAMA